MVNVLLEAGAEVNKANNEGGTPLHCAGNNSQLQIVNVLLEAGAEVNKTNIDGDTPLHEASRRGRLEVVRLQQVQR